MDQSIFKAVLIPYAVNMALDDEMEVSSIIKSCRVTLVTSLQNCADILWENLDKDKYPRAMFCNFYWGELYTGNANDASMGAMVSGASLMEGVARLCNALRKPTGINIMHNAPSSLIPHPFMTCKAGRLLTTPHPSSLIHHPKKASTS